MPTLDRLPPLIPDRMKVFAVTTVHPHTCFAKCQERSSSTRSQSCSDPSSVEKLKCDDDHVDDHGDEREDGERYDDDEENGEERDEDDETSKQENGKVDKGGMDEHLIFDSEQGSSSNTLLDRRQWAGRRAVRGPYLVHAVRKHFEKSGRKWKEKECLQAIREVDPNADKSMAASVLRKLRMPCRIAMDHQMALIQGLAGCLADRGFQVFLHVANAAGVRQQIFDIAKKRYLSVFRKRGDKAMPFTAKTLGVLLNRYPDEEDKKHLLGLTLIPVNTSCHRLDTFMPVDAMDCAGMRGAMTGIMVVRATKDAAQRNHPISISCMLSGESNAGVGAHRHAEQEAFDASEDVTDPTLKRAVLMDGGAALLAMHQEFTPGVPTFRCTRHLLDDLKKTAAGMYSRAHATRA